MLQSLYVPPSPLLPSTRSAQRTCKANYFPRARLSRINEDIIVRLKWGQTEYKGRLVSVDSYMNIQLSNTEEFVDGQSTGSLGQVLIRYDALTRLFLYLLLACLLACLGF